ncbi:hypothetical protein HTZ84_10600 [Haloterrigena sp. SYSU A558-1]|uniref:Uncharacterized protein n=1 Tax=Haloterrigena gelatinilytica TaxID=2741724 RepID=A0ABX2LEH3_9EURY|nr:hypothetical protein [Haloterrigena gelatinilytica]NUC72753.1 hypothetical protein [Haloterrigena gelatinilytica]
MSEPYGQSGRILAGIVLVGLLIGCSIWAGATVGDLTESRYPDETDVTPEPAAYVGDEVALGGYVVDTDPVVIATRASGYGRFTLVDTDARLRTADGPLERGDRVTAFGTLEDDSTLIVERAVTREPTETRYMLLASALGGLWVVGRFVRHWRVDRTALAFAPRDRSRSGRSDRENGPSGTGTRPAARANDRGADQSQTDGPRTDAHSDQGDRTAATGGEPRA